MIRRSALMVLALALVVTLVPILGSEGPSRAAPALIGKVRASSQPFGGKLFVLIIGNDARAGNPNQSRADALHLVGINTATMKGGILNFPRDSYIQIPGSGPGRINESLFRGGPELTVKTVEAVTGIKIDYWVMTGFEGFKRIIKGIKGVPYKIDRGLYDPTGSGIRLPARKKPYRMNADVALAYVRTRHSFPNGDIDRSTNQARFLLAMLRKLRHRVSINPATLLHWVALTKEHTRLNISPEETFRLGVLTSQMKPKDIGSVTVPVTLGSVGAASVVFIQPGAAVIYERFKRSASL